MASFNRFKKACRQLLQSTDGIATVETAIVFIFVFLPLLLGLEDFGVLYKSRFLVDEAAQDVVTYVLNAGGSATSSGVNDAAHAANGSINVVQMPFHACYCVRTDTTTPTMPASIACGGTCPGNSILEGFRKITLSLQVALPFPMAALNLASPYTVSTPLLIRGR